MSNNEKETILKDICLRLPYGSNVEIRTNGAKNCSSYIVKLTGKLIDDFKNDEIKEIRPILRPLSSMTKEERDYMVGAFLYDGVSLITTSRVGKYLDWMLTNDFDINGLIELGLAEVKEL